MESLSQANQSNEQAPSTLSQMVGGVLPQTGLLGSFSQQPFHGSYPVSGAQAKGSHTQEFEINKTQSASMGLLATTSHPVDYTPSRYIVSNSSWFTPTN